MRMINVDCYILVFMYGALLTDECYFYFYWQDDNDDDEDFDIPDLRARLAKHNINSSPDHSDGMFNNISTFF